MPSSVLSVLVPRHDSTVADVGRPRCCLGDLHWRSRPRPCGPRTSASRMLRILSGDDRSRLTPGWGVVFPARVPSLVARRAPSVRSSVVVRPLALSRSRRLRHRRGEHDDAATARSRRRRRRSAREVFPQRRGGCRLVKLSDMSSSGRRATWRARSGRHRRMPREGRPGIGEARWRLVQVRVYDRELALALERASPREALVEDAAERVESARAVDLAALDLLGRDVVDRADEATVTCQAADGRRRGGRARSRRRRRGPSSATRMLPGFTSRWTSPAACAASSASATWADEPERPLGSRRPSLPEQLRGDPIPRRTPSRGRAHRPRPPSRGWERCADGRGSPRASPPAGTAAGTARPLRAQARAA